MWGFNQNPTSSLPNGLGDEDGHVQLSRAVDGSCWLSATAEFLGSSDHLVIHTFVSVVVNITV